MIRNFSLVLTAASTLAIAGCSVEAPSTGVAVSSVRTSEDQAAHAVFEMGKENLAAGHLGLALEDFKKALAQSPRSAPILNALAVTYDRLGRHDIAELYFDRALAIDPGYSVALNNVGYSMLTRGRYEEALIYFDQALKEEPLAPAQRLIKANMQAAMDKLRLARQQGEMPAATKASLESGPAGEEDGCKMPSRHAVSRSGERAFVLITDPRSAERMRSLTTRDLRCTSSDRPRVAMINTAAVATPSAHVHQLTTAVTEKRMAESVPNQGNEQSKPAVAAQESDAKAKAPQVQATVPAEKLMVEVSNGAGRTKLAARMRGYLESKGLNVSYLTNAASFDVERTAVFYKTGQRQVAERFAKQLPISVELVESNENYADIRVRLGADILEFDKNVLYAVAMGERNV